MNADRSDRNASLTWKQAGQLVLLGVVTTLAAASILATIAIPETSSFPSLGQLYTALLP